MYRIGVMLIVLILSPVQVISGDTPEPFNAPLLPEVTTPVDMSSSDVNRVVCRGTIKDVIFSKEKGLSVTITGQDAFVKFLITRKEDGERYSNTPSELFVICGEDVYSLIAIPRRIPSQTIRLSSGKAEKIKKNISLMAGLPFEKKVTGLIQSAYTEDIPESFSVSPSHTAVDIFDDMTLTLRRTVVIEGEGLQLKEYRVGMREESALDSLQLMEKDFLRTELTERPVAISLTTLNLKKGESARLFIVEQTGGVDEREN